MSYPSRSLIVSMAALLSGTAVAQSALPAAAAAARSSARDEIATDPAVRQGVLANGMRYIILPNATPAGQVSMRFRFDAGSLHETDQQLGVAHFIEHMAFNGTRNVPEGEMVRMLERHGLAFGREIQATTSTDQTVYLLDIPAADAAKLDVAFLLMRELASEMLIEPDAIDRERGVILSEYRMRDVAAVRSFDAQDQFLYPTQLLSQRSPIGNPDVLRAVVRPAMVDYYHRLYRPERATLIVVGDVDPDRIAAEIETRFADWRGIGAAAEAPAFGQLRNTETEVASFVEAGVLDQVSATWLRPWRPQSPTVEARRREVRSRLVELVLERRLQRLLDSGDASFTAARVFKQRPSGTADLTVVSLDPIDGRFAETVAVLEREVRRLRLYSIEPAEMESAIVAMRTTLTTAVARAETRQSNTLADRLLNRVQQGEPILSPAQELELFESAVRGFDSTQAATVIEERFSGAGPLIFASAEAPIVGGDSGLRDAYAASARVAVERQPAMKAVSWAYESFGAPSAIVERREIEGLGTTLVRFANGMTLLVRPDPGRRNEVLVSARFAGGLATLPTNATTFTLTQGEGAFIGGGLADLPLRDVREALSGKTFSSVFEAKEDAFALNGATTPADLATQLQVLAAYATQPGWRPEVYRQKQAEAEALLGYVQATPINVAISQVGRFLRSGDGRYTLPTREEVTNTRLDTLRSVVDPALRSAPLEVLIVGDVTVEEAILQTAATFGSLPARDMSRTAPVSPPDFPVSSSTAHRIEHGGGADAAVAAIAWETTGGFTDPDEAAVLTVLQSIIRGRAIENIRERLGVAYSPFLVASASQTFEGYGYMALMAEVAPTKVDLLTETIIDITSDLQSRPVSDDELGRALQPLLASLNTEKAGNVYWRNALAGGAWDERRFERLRLEEGRLRGVTADDVQRAARRYLSKEAAHQITIMPQS